MNIAAILAGGTGSRMGGEIPKQFIEVDGVPIIVRTVEKFQRHSQIDLICIVCIAQHCQYMQELAVTYNLSKVQCILPGGKNRQESSFIAVKAMYDRYGPDGIILIHDGARPNVTAGIISENIRTASNIGACNTVIPSQDTVLISEDGETVSGYTDRRKMYLVQTPQSFSLKTIYEAHLKGQGRSDITDDCSLVVLSGGRVGLVYGDKKNVKITTREDLEWLKIQL